MDKLIRLSATEVVTLLKKKEIDPKEVIEAAIKRIEEVDPKINALPIKCYEHAWEACARLDKKACRYSQKPGWLAGLPIAVKDLAHVKGVKTTMGGLLRSTRTTSPNDPATSVENLENCGALPIAKAASPEFGFNATTFSTLWGETKNPWDTTKTTAGSSGGSAAAVASGEVWMATGSDLGSSIRAHGCVLFDRRPAAKSGAGSERTCSATVQYVAGGRPDGAQCRRLRLDARCDAWGAHRRSAFI